MKNKKNKFEKNLDSNRLAGFLRSLASGVEGSSEDTKGSFGLDLSGLDAVKMEIKRKKGGTFGLKLKLELTGGKGFGGSSTKKDRQKKEASTVSDAEKNASADNGDTAESVQNVSSEDAKSVSSENAKSVSSENAKSVSGDNRLNVQIDDLNCSGCEDCVDSLPNVFEMTEDGELARVKMTNIPAELEDDIREAADDCPAEAISIE